MFFHTPAYLIFLLAVVIVHRLLPNRRSRHVWLLICSYIFYVSFDFRFALILVLLTLANFFVGQQIALRARRRVILVLGVALNLGVLGLFKYADFFLDSFTALLGNNELSPGLKLLLPIGISFYTFQGISYLIEIRRGKLNPSESLIELGLYIAFFPKLIAGPIVRPVDFFTQLGKEVDKENQSTISDNLKLLLTGLFKKIVIADTLASLADVAFRAATSTGEAGPFPTPLYLQGFYLYAVQIYADFSGYTDIALASAGLLGFRLPSNFREPYLATTVSDFWNRWHMSLTQWFREYLFFPLTRSWLTLSDRRHQTAIQIAANFVTMLLIGLWHGAAWTFVAWGLWHAALLTIERLGRWKPRSTPSKLLGMLLTFHLVAAGWVLFRAESFVQAARFFQGLFALDQMYWLSLYMPSIILAVFLMLTIDIYKGKYLDSMKARLKSFEPLWIVTALIVISALLLLRNINGDLSRPFIYGQF